MSCLRWPVHSPVPRCHRWLWHSKLQEALGKPVIVEYKAGAGTNIGSDYVAKSAPDGYTLLINGITPATNPSLYPNMPFNPAKDFAPIIEVAEMLNVVTVHPGIAVNSLKELVELIKKRPRQIQLRHAGRWQLWSLVG